MDNHPRYRKNKEYIKTTNIVITRNFLKSIYRIYAHNLRSCQVRELLRLLLLRFIFFKNN